MSNVPWLNETERADYWKSAWETERKESDKLQSQLAAKDAEIARLTAERAQMLEAIRRLDLVCDNCKHRHEDDCDNPDFDCGACQMDCICKSCRDNSNWEWRGAEEG